jgi:hypothetical protein
MDRSRLCLSRFGLRVSSGTCDLPRSEYDAHWLSCFRYDNSSYTMNFSCHVPYFQGHYKHFGKNRVFYRECIPTINPVTGILPPLGCPPQYIYYIYYYTPLLDAPSSSSVT